MVRIVVRFLVGADVDGPVVQRHVVGERVVVVLVFATGVVLVEEYLETVVVPVLHQRIAVRVDQDVVDELAEYIKLAFRPDDFEPSLEVLRTVHRPQPARGQFAPLRSGPDGLVSNTIDTRRDGRVWCPILRAALVVGGIGACRPGGERN